MQNAYDDQIFKTGKFMLSEFDKKFIAYLNDVYDLKIIYIINVMRSPLLYFYSCKQCQRS